MTYPNYELIEYICRVELRKCEIKYPRFKMWTFSQTWGSTATGFDRSGMLSGQAFTDEYTTVVEAIGYYKSSTSVNVTVADTKFYFVFFGNKFAYMIVNPNEEFFKDLKNMDMKSVGKFKSYISGDIDE